MLRRWIAASLAAAGTALAAGLYAGVAAPRPVRAHAGARRHRLLVLRTNALHTDIGLPATPEVRRRFAHLADVGIPIRDQRLTHLLVGWGAEGFYPNNARPHRIGPLALVRAVIGDDSVLRFAALAEANGAFAGKDVHHLSGGALEALLRFVEETLERDADGRLKPLDHPGIMDLDHFYEARLRFAAPAGCNVWVAKALAEAGIPTGRWTPLPRLLTASIARHSARRAPAAPTLRARLRRLTGR